MRSICAILFVGFKVRFFVVLPVCNGFISPLSSADALRLRDPDDSDAQNGGSQLDASSRPETVDRYLTDVYVNAYELPRDTPFLARNLGDSVNC